MGLYYANDPIWYLIDDESILTGYRIQNPQRRDDEFIDDEGELSEYVRARLLLARLLALRKYNEVMKEKGA